LLLLESFALRKEARALRDRKATAG
jgi:hypothetical protein